MEYWEFLLQQEGDSNWLPLDTSQMEILEGRYRIMAHCSRANTPVQIQIGQLLSHRVPPKRRSLKRQGQTNDNGLMVVLPFTRLSAGTWDIHCQGIAQDRAEASTPDQAESPSPSWRYAIQLRVLPPDAGEDGDWFADDGSHQSIANDSGMYPEGSAAGSPGEPSHAPTVWPGLDLQQVAEVIERAQTRLAGSEDGTDFLYTLTMAQTALMAVQGHPLQFTGEARGVVSGESCSDMALVVRLSDPQSAEVLTLVPFSLASNALPSSFSISLDLPDTLSTRLLLGELVLISWQAGTVSLLALQRFTVTVNLAALFDELANRVETEANAELVFAPDKLADDGGAPGQTTDTAAGDSDGWAALDFPVAPPRAVPTITLPRNNAPIPPRIYYPSPHEATAHIPSLPPLGKTKPASSPLVNEPQPGSLAPVDANSEESFNPPPEQESESEPLTSPLASTSSATASGAAPQGLSLPHLKSLPSPLTAAEEAALLNLSADHRRDQANPGATAPPKPRPDALQLPSHETMAFKALNLQERFWTRLNDLAITLQQEAQHTRQLETDAWVPPLEEGTEEPIFIPFAGEVVIYDDADPTPDAATPERATNRLARLNEEEDIELVTPPMPEIELSSHELVAGETVLLTLRVPFHPNRLYLKVWITDPQTRSLTDEPRQITHLSPNGRGQLEGTIQLTVPMGCLEAWFEAISVDMVTQQESYKASQNCSISPPDAPIDLSPLDEFEL